MPSVRLSLPLAFLLFGALAAQVPNETVLTAKLMSNRALFNTFEQQGIDLRVLADTQNTDINRQLNLYASEGICAGADCPTEEQKGYLQIAAAVAQSDVVITDQITSQMSAFSTHNGFVFTDSEFVLSEVLKPVSHANIYPGSEITVASPGGTVIVDGHHVTATVSTIAPLQNDHKYLLFLKYLPDSDSYEMTDILGFDVSGKLTVPVSASDPDAITRSIGDPQFLTLIHASINRAVREARQ